MIDLQTNAGKAWAPWLWREFDWHHGLTLTFARAKAGRSGPPTWQVEEVTPARSRWCWDRFLETLEQSCWPIWYARADEAGQRTGRRHIHAVIGGTARLPEPVIRRAWRFGIAQVEPNPDRGWIEYVCKGAPEGLTEPVIDSRIRFKSRRWQRRCDLGRQRQGGSGCNK